MVRAVSGKAGHAASAEESEETVVNLLVLIEGVPSDVVGFFSFAGLAITEETAALCIAAEADTENDSEY